MWDTSSPQLDHGIAALVEEFSGIFAPQTIADCVVDSYELLSPAHVTDFLPLLAYRLARERLQAVARVEAHTQTAVPPVLFVCTHNAGTSQLAAALLAQLGGDRIEIASAASHPTARVAPEVLAALAELGLEASALFPKPITDEVISGADVVVTMGCGDSCPVVPGRRYLDWHPDQVASPSGMSWRDAWLAAVAGIEEHPL